VAAVRGPDLERQARRGRVDAVETRRDRRRCSRCGQGSPRSTTPDGRGASTINPESLERDPKGVHARTSGPAQPRDWLPPLPPCLAHRNGASSACGRRHPGSGGKVHERHQDAVDRRGSVRRLRSEGHDGARSHGV
jgi:hypothetical protein